MSKTLELTKSLVSRQSITPHDDGCQDIIGKRLEAVGFNVHALPFGDVKNVWARRGTEAPLFLFSGHTDVVPPGPLDLWKSDPFTPTILNNQLVGRGVSDMKGSVAAMTVACEHFLEKNPYFKGSIGFLITSDEEGDSINGTKKVVEYLREQNIGIDYCLVGEASCEKRFGDTIKIGRRGSLSGVLTIHGKQGHVAYTGLDENPIITVAPALVELSKITWDTGNHHFPPTTFQVSNIHAGTGAENMTPSSLQVMFNLRYSTQNTAEALEKKVCEVLDARNLEYEIEWHRNGNPFITCKGELIDALCQVVREKTGITPTLSTTGGTSDGRFLAPICKQLLEFGLCNPSIHQANEHTNIDDLDALTEVYEELLQRLLQMHSPAEPSP